MEWLEKSQKFISALRYYYPDVNATQQDLESAFEKFLKGFPDLIKKNIKTLREKHNISQRELASKLNITQSSYSGWETGAHVPKLENLKQLAMLLDLDPYEFIGDTSKTVSDAVYSVPVFDNEFFFSKDFVFLSNQLAKIDVVTAKEYGVKEFRCCSSPLKDSFVFFNRSEDMVGTRNTIPANSYVYCSFESLKVFDRIERLEAANDKVALVKLGEGAPLLRQVIFDSNHLILRAWNDKVSDMIFPISKGSIGVYGSRDYVSMANGELIYAEGVEIYGIAYEYAKTIDISR